MKKDQSDFAREMRERQEERHRAFVGNFGEEWEAKMRKADPPAPIHASTLHLHDASCFDGSVSERVTLAAVEIGKTCLRTGTFIATGARERRG